jgi:hypothetical protein
LFVQLFNCSIDRDASQTWGRRDSVGRESSANKGKMMECFGQSNISIHLGDKHTFDILIFALNYNNEDSTDVGLDLIKTFAAYLFFLKKKS